MSTGNIEFLPYLVRCAATEHWRASRKCFCDYWFHFIIIWCCCGNGSWSNVIAVHANNYSHLNNSLVVILFYFLTKEKLFYGDEHTYVHLKSNNLADVISRNRLSEWEWFDRDFNFRKLRFSNVYASFNQLLCKAYFVPNSWTLFFACLNSIRIFGFVLLDLWCIHVSRVEKVHFRLYA